MRRIPDGHAPDLEALPVGADLHQPLRRIRLEREAPAGAVGEAELSVRAPPLADLGGDRAEGSLRGGGDPHRDEDP